MREPYEEPGFAGLPTFEKARLVTDASALGGADVVIVGAPMDDMASNRPGTRLGPRAIRQAFDGGGRRHLDLGVTPFDALTIVDHGDAPVVPGDPLRSHGAIGSAVAAVCDAGAVPVVLGGDHSIAFPDIAAVAERCDRGSLAVVQFDTHADTATDIAGVKWSHGSPFRHLVDDGVVPGERLVQVGLRGYWPNEEEFAWARSKGVRWHRMEEIDDRGIDAVCDDVVAEVGDAQHLFLSVDVDVLDPAYAPGTGTPEPGGLTTRELLRAVRRLVMAKGLAGMEVVEVSPPYDHAEITAWAAHTIVLEALSALALQKAGATPRPEDPASQ